MNGSDSSVVILSVCGIAAVVGVCVILAGFLVVRIMKGSIFGMAMMAMKIFTEPKEDGSESAIRAESVSRNRPRDLRAEARSVDFDSAVARYSNGNPVNPTTPTTPTYSAQAAPPLGNPPATPTLGNRRRRRPKEHEEDVDFLETFTDED